MRIAYIGNYTRSWSTETHVAESLAENGHQVVRLQEDALRPEEWAGLGAWAERNEVDFVLWTRTWATPMDVALPGLVSLRERAIPSIAYHLDRWWGLNRQHQVEDQPYFRCDLVVTADGGHAAEWERAGVRHRWLPPAVYGAEARLGGTRNRALASRVAFVGSHPYPHPEWEPVRSRLIAAFQAAFGRDFRVWTHADRVRGLKLNDLYASVDVVLGDSCLAPAADGSPMRRYWSDRIPETLGRGGFLLHPDVDGLSLHHEPGEHLLVFPVDDPAAAVELARGALADPAERRGIAESGRADVLARHTYCQRAETLVAWARELRFGLLDESVGLTRVRHASGASADLVLAEGDTDGIVAREVWDEDVYRLADPDARADIAGRVVIDVGGNIGAFSILAAKLGAFRVHAYEPSPSTLQRLRDNVVANDMEGIVLAHLHAVGAERSFGLMTDSGVAGGRRLATRAADFEGEVVRVPVVPLAEILDAHEEIGVLKVDIEGGEYDAFESCPPVLLDRVRRIVIEFHGSGTGTDAAPERVERLAMMLSGWGEIDVLGDFSVGGMIYGTRRGRS